MAESLAENSGSTQDLFSPLQFCEVVEEGQQQRQQHLSQHQMQLLHQHQSHLAHQQLTALRSPQLGHPHQPQNTAQQQQQHHQPQIPNPNQLQPQQSQQPIKQETPQQAIQPQLLYASEAKSQTLMNSVSGMEVFLTSNPVQLQTVAPPLGAIHQQHLSQHMYQVQLMQQQQQTLQQLHLGPLQLQAPPQGQSLHLPLHNHSHSQEAQPSSIPMGIPAINGGNCGSFALPVSILPAPKAPTTNAVANQTTPTDRSALEGDDGPEIVYTSVSTSMVDCPGPPNSTNPTGSDLNGGRPVKANTVNPVTNGSNEVKVAPVKRTWRRPWKKKKEWEKRQPVKKTRRLKRRRRIVMPKNIIHVDPRHGPSLAGFDSTIDESVYADPLDCRELSLPKIMKEVSTTQVEVLKEPHQDEFCPVLKEPKEEGIPVNVNLPPHNQVAAAKGCKDSMMIRLKMRSVLEMQRVSVENNVSDRQAIRHSNRQNYRCSDCDYECKRKRYLKQHVLTHFNIKKFKCSDCEYKCNRKSHLERHMLIHCNIKQFRCLKCDYECNQKSHLKQHMLTHYKIKLFSCSNCDYECNQKSHLRQHMFTHSNIKLFKCSDCNYECNQKSDLKRHMLTKCQRKVIET